MPYRIQVFYPPPPASEEPPISTLLPGKYYSLCAVNAEARDLAEIEYCIPDVETALCVSGSGQDVLEVWTVGEIGRGFGMEGVRLVVRVVVVDDGDDWR
jgi:hypothetical protein